MRYIFDLVDISGEVAKHTFRFENVSDILLKRSKVMRKRFQHAQSADMRGLNDVWWFIVTCSRWQREDALFSDGCFESGCRDCLTLSGMWLLYGATVSSVESCTMQARWTASRASAQKKVKPAPIKSPISGVSLITATRSGTTRKVEFHKQSLLLSSGIQWVIKRG